MQMLNTVDALAVQLFQKREGASNRLDGGSGSHVVLLNDALSLLSRASPSFHTAEWCVKPLAAGLLLGINGCRSPRRVAFQAGPVHQQGKSRRRSNQKLTVVASGRWLWPRCRQSKLHRTIWSGGVAVTISAIHRVSLATHDLAEAQNFFKSYIGLGRPVKVADQTIAFGGGSRGLQNQKAAEAAQ